MVSYKYGISFPISLLLAIIYHGSDTKSFNAHLIKQYFNVIGHVLGGLLRVRTEKLRGGWHHGAGKKPLPRLLRPPVKVMAINIHLKKHQSFLSPIITREISVVVTGHYNEPFHRSQYYHFRRMSGLTFLKNENIVDFNLLKTQFSTWIGPFLSAKFERSLAYVFLSLLHQKSSQ